MINSSSAELVALFYQGLAEKCPELLGLFAKEKE
jgi:hemoglobin-like flavoprotein